VRVAFFFFVFLALGGAAKAQAPSSPPADESRIHADFRHEGEQLKADCSSFSLKSVGSCAELLFTAHPVHIAVGSIAPQNGFGAGPAFTTHWTPNESWRLSWNVDAIVSSNASWRAGVYMKAIYDPPKTIRVGTGASGRPQKSNLVVSEYPVLGLYVQSMSLNKIAFFGLGPSTSEAQRSYFGMRETILGSNVTWPVIRPWNVSLYGEVNGRFVNLRGDSGEVSPSIEQIYNETTAPGLTSQPPFAQFGEGVRIRPTFFGDYLRLNYFVTFQQFLAAGDSAFSFRRFTVDLAHQIPLYRKTTRTLLPRDLNGPDECSLDKDLNCPAITRDREGSIGLRLLISESMAPAGHVVPFYFQPTLGGSDINGNPWLSSYQDYRFRAPNIMVLRASFEHSVYGPLGVTFAVDEGKVALNRDDIDFSHLLHSYSAGLTLRAGGLPQVWLIFAWGGHEGTHTIGNVNTSLLGGAIRPSLF
jgi:hypothetical protein